MSQNDRAYSEKRDYIRMRVETSVIVHYAGEEIQAHCLDLSSTGMQLEANSNLAEGNKVRVHIPSDHPELKGLDVEAQVVRAITLEDGRQELGLNVLSMK